MISLLIIQSRFYQKSILLPMVCIGIKDTMPAYSMGIKDTMPAYSIGIKDTMPAYSYVKDTQVCITHRHAAYNDQRCMV